MKPNRFYLIIFLILFFVSFSHAADTWIRFNRAGYMPASPKRMTVMSEKDLKGKGWSIVNGAGKKVLSGALGESICGIGDHTPKPFNYAIDFSSLKTEGTYRLELAGQLVSFRIARAPFAFLIPDIIRFMRVARSGTADTLFHKASHMGDRAALLHFPKDGKPETGLWEPAADGRTVDMSGGWYDAGDYIKFTLTTAFTAYLMLRAYELNPALFKKKYSRSPLPDILDEIKFGLDYLVKAYPSKDIFIIQVSGRDDHEVGWRLPEKDNRDGKREAFAAISPSHMGLTAAALALGSRTFARLGYKKEAKLYKEKAASIFRRVLQPDAMKFSAFEYDDSGGFSFYRDKDPSDNMILGAVELFNLTGDKGYIDIARKYVGGRGDWVSWDKLYLFANLALGPHDERAQTSADGEIAAYIKHSLGNVWGAPFRYSWGSLANWVTLGAALGASRRHANDAAVVEMMNGILDYTFGRNNWGLTFFFTDKIPNAMRHCYNQIYDINKVYPTGALSEGPAGREVHDRNLDYFKFKPEDQPTFPFNTRKVVFYDHPKDFCTQESTISGQAAVLLFLSAMLPPHAGGPIN